MAWTTPRTWVTSEIVTAALLNTHIRDNESYLKGNADAGVDIDGYIRINSAQTSMLALRSTRNTANLSYLSLVRTVNDLPYIGIAFDSVGGHTWQFYKESNDDDLIMWETGGEAIHFYGGGSGQPIEFKRLLQMHDNAVRVHVWKSQTINSNMYADINFTAKSDVGSYPGIGFEQVGTGGAALYMDGNRLPRWIRNDGVDVKIWNELNDGSGSGLDADTLDGLQASAFALAGSYLPLTGGTLSGPGNLAVGGTLSVGGGNTISKIITGSGTWDPPAIANGSQNTQTFTVTGAALQDLVIASYSNSLTGVTMTAYVSAADTVTVVLHNHTGSSQDLGSGTFRFIVIKF